MSTFFRLAAILITISRSSDPYQLIPADGNWWYDDFQYDAAAAYDETSKWYRAIVLPQDLGSTISTCTECQPPANEICPGCTQSDVWGWWIRYDAGSSVGKDPSRSMERRFRCASHSNVTVKARAYFCMYCDRGSEQIFYFKRSGFSSILWSINGDSTRQQNMIYNSGWSNVGGSGSNKPGTSCNAEIQYVDIDDYFEVIPDAEFQISISQEVQQCYVNGAWRIGYQAVAFNQFRVKCDRIITSPPTRAPTQPTSMPSKAPSKNPSKQPSINPTKAPTLKPTLNPTNPTRTPTQAPSIPSKSPTKYPTVSPTGLPTGNPIQAVTTKAPTFGGNTSHSTTTIVTTAQSTAALKPTLNPKSPTRKPTKRPTTSTSKAPTFGHSTTAQSTAAQTTSGNFTECIKDVSILDGDGSISIDIDAISEKLMITLRGPSGKWFGIGFGNHVMSGTYVIIISGDMEINERKLGNEKEGTLITDSFESKSGVDFFGDRIVNIVRYWNVIGNDDVYDFTAFFQCKIRVLNIIWAHGVNLNFGYHGTYKNNLLHLSNTCICGETDEPTTNPVTPIPSKKPTEDVTETNNAYHTKFIMPKFLFILVVFSVYQMF